ncbi:MAG: trehalose-phosphatase, partial [Pseudomonadota bacterium]
MVLPLRDTALFLDVDGTLLEIQDQPDAVISNPQLTDLLTALAQRLGGALALVSGRPIDEIDRIFAPEVFCAAGGHGVQLRLPDGSLETHPTRMPASTVQLLQDGLMGHAGTFLERKSHGLALH